MKLSSGGKLLLAELEGKRAKMYLDSAGLPTIGIGHLITSSEPHLMTATLTDSQIYALLDADLVRFENAVQSAVRIPLEQHQRDALIILAFNIGTTGFRNSTVVARINAKAPEADIREAWGRWKMAGGQVVQGLINRRNREMELYFTGAEKKSSNFS
jgi:lysozyme